MLANLRSVVAQVNRGGGRSIYTASRRNWRSLHESRRAEREIFSTRKFEKKMNNFGFGTSVVFGYSAVLGWEMEQLIEYYFTMQRVLEEYRRKREEEISKLNVAQHSLSDIYRWFVE